MGRIQSLCSWDDTNLSDLRDEYLAGCSYKQLAHKYGCSTATISHSLHRAGVAPRIKKCLIDAEYFETLDTPSKCYWFGFLCADGYVNRLKTCVRLKSADVGHLQLFREAVGSTHSIRQVCRRSPFGLFPHVVLEISSKQMSGHLLRHKIYDIKSGIIESLHTISFLSSWIAGYFDGDGWISFKRTHNQRVCAWGICGPRPTIEFVLNEVASKCGFPLVSVFPNGTVYKFQYGGSLRVRKICEWLGEYDLPRLSRKYIKYRSLAESFNA